MSVIHNVKCVFPYYSDVLEGRKTFECRFNDRNYKVGDIVVLHYYDTVAKVCTGAKCSFVITYILNDSFVGVSKGYVIIGFTEVLFIS